MRAGEGGMHRMDALRRVHSFRDASDIVRGEKRLEILPRGVRVGVRGHAKGACIPGEKGERKSEWSYRIERREYSYHVILFIGYIMEPCIWGVI